MHHNFQEMEKVGFLLSELKDQGKGPLANWTFAQSLKKAVRNNYKYDGIKKIFSGKIRGAKIDWSVIRIDLEKLITGDQQNRAA